ncbi:hypothetical protein FEI13_17695 [Halomonas urmiana]|uniref:O-antigen ligase family protein n=1 Tax=Halomonas urmiana TaxID=490901 RepID=A0A5R8M8S3_9GAMM|nr:hypothetical protein [Halomonas urmiana]TLF45907.1 hypothetical protein FEI13_17695 [Halomonas urmiana]
MIVNKYRSEKSFLRFWALLLFVVLPLGQLPYFVLGGTLPSPLLVWREVVVFLIPAIYILFYGLVVARFVILAVVIMSVLTSFLVFMAGAASLNSGIPLVLGALTYFSVIWLSLFFHSLPHARLLYILKFLKYSMIFGGGGLVVDYVSGYSISSSISGGERIDSQITLVPRALFLYTSVTFAASLLGVMLLFNSILAPIVYTNDHRGKGYVNVVAVLCAVGGILVTFSRVGFVLIFLWAIFNLVTKVSLKSIISGLFSLCFSFAFLWAFLGDKGTDFLYKRVESLFVLNENVDSHRILRWKEGVDDMVKNFFTGAGVGTGNTRSAQYIGINHYESTPLWVFNESGLIGFLVFFSPYISSIYFLVRARISFKDKISIFYLWAGMLFAISINPGGSAYLFVALIVFLSACLANKSRRHCAE